MPNSSFLMEYPLYRNFSFASPSTLDKFGKVPVKMFCPICSSEQTFLMVNEFYTGFGYANAPSANALVNLIYKCTSCNTFPRYFALRVNETRTLLTKVGQFPAWEIESDDNIEGLLQHKAFYKRGLICESQGYGIGAFAYYRRIVEEVIDGLLDQVSELMAGPERARYDAALEQTKKTRITAEKIELVKDLLPPTLRPSGMNPLRLLHEMLSEGLHAESDERCLELAMAVRKVLLFLTAQVAESVASRRAFTEGMRGLLEEKSKRALPSPTKG